MDKFEFGDLNRFFVSLGLTLVLGSLGIMWLFYREPFDLARTVAELNGLTPLAKAIILERQRHVGRALTLVPWLALGGVLTGLFLFFLGLFRWIPSQKTVEQIQDLTRKKLENEVRRMTPAEVITKAYSEVAVQEPAAVTARSPDDGDQQVASLQDPVSNYLQNENLLLDALATHLPDKYELLPYQQSAFGTYDALLRAKPGAGPDFIVEFKDLSRTPRARYLDDALRVASMSADWMGLDMVNRQIPLVIAIVPENSAALVEEALKLLERDAKHPTAFGRSLLRLISPKRLAKLNAADMKAVLDPSRRLVVLAEEQ
jgi:hypothetical protein